MSETIYFSKVEFTEYIGRPRINPDSIMLLNIPERELSYQVFKYKRSMPAIVGEKNCSLGSDRQFKMSVAKGGKIISNSFTDNRGVLLEDDIETEVVFSYGIKIPKLRMNELLFYCNALDFEPYRDRTPEFFDEGVIGYRDEVSMRFRGITNSHIPLLELSMNYYYDEEHIWPTERLYRYLVKSYFEHDKKLKGRGPHYGSLSLFC